MVRRIVIGLFLTLFFFTYMGRAYAQATTPTPGKTEWRFDAKTTEVGRRAERARQFVNWVVTHQSIDNHPVFRQVWLLSASTTFFLVVLVVALMGVGLILAKKRDVSFRVDVIPILNKTALLLVYTAFSYWIVLGLIQISDVMMQFFIKALDADKLFTIFFNANQTQNYKFIGYRNFDPLVDESVKASWFLVDVSSFTYFVMGIVLILRKVMLWFLLIVGPFMALLMPFRFIRNIGWIWIGVFFQWAFYGPLFALFLGALTQIWKAGIPYSFNFTNAKQNKTLYDLSINILYGGPQQVSGGLGSPLNANLSQAGAILGGNSSSYVDTFAEYVISLVMLWAVMILPWWLLRIFRDYCCDGIYAMKNILLNMLNQQQQPPPKEHEAPKPNMHFSKPLDTQSDRFKDHEIKVVVDLKNLADVKKMSTVDISKQMNMQVSKLSDIARFETNKQQSEYASKLMQYMRNPMAAESGQQRSEFIKLKTELSQRASRGDVQAQHILEATTNSAVTMRTKIHELAQTKPQTITVTQNIAQTLNISEQRVEHIANSVVQNVTSNQQTINNIAQTTNVSAAQASQVIQNASQAAKDSKPTEVASKAAEKAGVDKEKAEEVLKKTAEKATEEEAVKEVAEKENVDAKAVKQVAEKMFGAGGGGETPADNIANSPTIGIDEYEEIKQMWSDHYAKGEVPLSEEIKTRSEWIEKDMAKLDNILNKLVSDNEEVRAAALQEVSEIIPFFMLGNMNIQDIATYLKAKRSAAKDVKKSIEKETEITEKAEKKDEEFVELDKVKKEENKTLEMEMDMPDESEKKPQESEINPQTLKANADLSSSGESSEPTQNSSTDEQT